MDFIFYRRLALFGSGWDRYGDGGLVLAAAKGRGGLSLFLFLTPLFGLGMAALVFDERLGLFESVGVILILAGIGVVAIKSV